MKKLSSLLSQLQTEIPNHEKLNRSVSKSSVGWHVEHSLQVILQIAEVLKKSNPADYSWKFNLARTLVYTFKKIPRGRGKAPKSVLPSAEITMESLYHNLAQARVKIQELEQLHPHSNFMHPYFGRLHLKSAIRFLNIHTKHHLKILKDIVGDTKV